jgi:hypothetical protein
MMMRVVPPIQRLRPALGTMLAPRVTGSAPNVKMLSSKTIISQDFENPGDAFQIWYVYTS